MSRLGIIMCRVKSFLPAIAIFLLTCASVFGEDAGNLKGLSIVVKYTTVTTLIRNGMVRTTPPEDREARLYIGTENHVFMYGRSPGEGGYAVTEFGRARSREGGRMQAYTMIDGKLIQVNKLVQGYHIATISLNLTRDSCTFSLEMKPDSTGKIVGFNPFTKQPFELISRTVKSSTCIVQKGNIFAE